MGAPGPDYVSGVIDCGRCGDLFDAEGIDAENPIVLCPACKAAPPPPRRGFVATRNGGRALNQVVGEMGLRLWFRPMTGGAP